GTGQVTGLGAAQEAEAVGQDLQHAVGGDALAMARQHLQQREDHVLLARAGDAFVDVQLFGQVEQLMRRHPLQVAQRVLRETFGDVRRRQARGLVVAIAVFARRPGLEAVSRAVAAVADAVAASVVGALALALVLALVLTLALAVAVVLLARLPAVLRLSGVAASGGFRLWRRGCGRRGRRGRFGGWRGWRALRRGGLDGLGGLAHARLAHALFGGVAGVVGVVGQVRNPRLLRAPWTGG